MARSAQQARGAASAQRLTTAEINVKKPDEMAANSLYSEKEHKTRAATLRRLAGGIRANAGSGAFVGFDVSERKLLASAATLLEAAAHASAKASSLAKGRRAAKEAREAAVLEAMSATFCKLTSAADRVALIAASGESYQLSPSFGKYTDELGRAFNDAMMSVARTLAVSAPAQAPVDIVAEAWKKFVEAKPELQHRHDALIRSL
jgi:hypothetical protein